MPVVGAPPALVPNPLVITPHPLPSCGETWGVGGGGGGGLIYKDTTILPIQNTVVLHSEFG